MTRISFVLGNALLSLCLFLPHIAQAQVYNYTFVVPGSSFNGGLECALTEEKACACALAAAAAVCVARGGLPVPSPELPIITGKKYKLCQWSVGCVIFE